MNIDRIKSLLTEARYASESPYLVRSCIDKIFEELDKPITLDDYKKSVDTDIVKIIGLDSAGNVR